MAGLQWLFGKIERGHTRTNRQTQGQRIALGIVWVALFLSLSFEIIVKRKSSKLFSLLISAVSPYAFGILCRVMDGICAFYKCLDMGAFHRVGVNRKTYTADSVHYF